MPQPSSELVYATAVAMSGRAVLLAGRSGAGKSDLALRLIDRGAVLIGDDYVLVRRGGTRLFAAPQPRIAGRMEVRGVGIVERAYVADVPVALIVDLDAVPERLPAADRTRILAGVAVPCIALAGLEPSAPLKVEAALDLFGKL